MNASGPPADGSVAAGPTESGAPTTAGTEDEGPVPGRGTDGDGAAWRRLSYLGPVGFALVVLVASVGYLVTALGYGRGTAASPGPGLFPQVVAVCLIVSALGTAVTSVRRPASQPAATDGREQRRLGPMATVIGAVIFVATLQTVGFFLAAIILLVIVELGMGVRNPFRVALFAIVLAFVAQLIFVDALGLKFFSTLHILDGHG